ncbi:hypothetical protein CHS0354_004112 [Potamilus streckersoni]|uniref:Uncharacterized protein n=1 Tax=Potamilus streckersoni TaxID=2493646 RepID=A0AAE0SJL3_9BIVA|nr:hypothetical protein CHS0354_004112 [Potamilus streckersoni]
MLSVSANIDDGTFTCDCDNPCSDIAFDVAISGRKWPNDDYLEKVLMKELCEKERKRNGTYITNKCVKWSNGSFSDIIQR